VFGKVQGCNFTKAAVEEAEKLTITGWVKNCRTGTIAGRLQGPSSNVEQMVKWLSEEGSPGCTIEKCVTNDWKKILRPDYQKFVIKF